jgi:hypothetical protein
VLLRPRIRARHGLDEAAIDTLLTEITASGILREPNAATHGAPDPGDRHLRDLLTTQPDAVLVTGDRALLEASTPSVAAMAPREVVERFLQ